MNKTKFVFLILLSLLSMLKAADTAGQGFSYYPEDKTFTNNYFYVDGYTFMIAYYPSDTATSHFDTRNGVEIVPSADLVNAVISPVTYKIDDSFKTDALYTVQTNSYQYLKYTVSSDDTVSHHPYGLVIDFKSALQYTMYDEVLVYLWIINPGNTAQGRKIYVCEMPQACTEIKNFWIDIDDQPYAANELRVEKVSLKRNPANASVLVTINDNTARATVLQYNASGDSLYLNFAFQAQTNIRLSLMTVHINNNRLKGTRFDHDNPVSCITVDSCLPGYSCTNQQCQAECFVPCRSCTFSNDANSPTQCQECSPISQLWKSGPTAVTLACDPIDHLDLTQLSDLQFDVPARVSNSYTVGFWLLIDDISKFGDNLINFIFEKQAMLSVGYTGDQKLTTFLNPSLRFTTDYELTTSSSVLKTLNTNRPGLLIKNTMAGTNGRWIHYRYALNTDQNIAYSLLEYNQRNSATRNLVKMTTQPKGYYTGTIIPDFTLKYFYGENMYFKITNASAMWGVNTYQQTSVFLRSLNVFTDYIPDTSKFQYYDFTSLADTSTFPSLYFIIDPIYDYNAQTLKWLSFYGSYAAGDAINNGVKTEMTIANPTRNSNGSFKIPTSFYRLNLVAVNSYFINFDLTSNDVGTLTCNNINTPYNQYCDANSSPISCTDGSYFAEEKGCVASCPSNSLINYGMYSGGNTPSNYCSMACGTNNVTCIAQSDYNLYPYKFACLNSFFNINYNCVSNDDSHKGALLYTGYFGVDTPKIIIPLKYTNALTSYYVEVWMYIDRAYVPKYNDGDENYLWYTDSISIVRNNNKFDSYRIKGPFGSTRTDIPGDQYLSSTFTMNYGQWQHIAYQVTNKNLSFFYNRRNINGDLTATASNNLSMSNIYFTGGKTAINANDGAIKWGSAFYRDIKVWDNTLGYIPTYIFKQFDRYWEYLDYSVSRFSLLGYYYPLSLYYLKANGLQDRDFTNTHRVGTDGDGISNKESSQSFNYEKSFDSITNFKFNSGYSSFENYLWQPTETLCPAGCMRCNTLECLQCDNTDNYILILGTCTQKLESKFYFIAPAYAADAYTPTDLTFAPVSTVTNSITISFFVKMLAWNTGADLTIILVSRRMLTMVNEFDLIRFGTGLRLIYNISDKTLRLQDNEVMPNTYVTYTNFFAQFGYWTQISFSYAYYSTMVAYYPRMANFQINNQSFAISTANMSFAATDLNTITIPRENIGVYAKLWVSNKYTNGAYPEVTNSNRLFKDSFTKLIDGTNYGTPCITSSTLTVASQAFKTECVLDYQEPILVESEYCTVYSFLSMTTNLCTTVASTSVCKYGYYDSSDPTMCSCTSDSTIRDAYIIPNNNINKCKALDYIDFGQIDSKALTVSSANFEYTIEFWTFIRTYVAGTFTGGFELRWNNQLKIVINNLNNAYQSTCYPIYIDENTNTFMASNSKTLGLGPLFTQWLYVRCSVSLKNLKFFHIYLNTYAVDRLETNLTIPVGATLPVIGTSTTFSLVNNSLNRGVIFFRQIRLWACYNCQQPVVYRQEINTLAQYYNALLHFWDPVWTSNSYSGTISDLRNPTSVNTSFTLSAATSPTAWIGYNVLDITNYVLLIAATSQLCNADLSVCPTFTIRPIGGVGGGWSSLTQTACRNDALPAVNSQFKLVNGQCVNNSNILSHDLFFFSAAYASKGSPTRVDLQLLPADGVTTTVINAGVTVSTLTQFSCSFFAKISTLTADTEIFRYGADLRLKFRFADNSLILTNTGATKIFAVYPNFNSLFGLWIHFGLSYYYNSTVNDYYPAMLNLQINSTNVVILAVDITNLNVNLISIPKEVNGTFGKVWVLPRYLVGVIAEVSFTATSYLFTKYIDLQYYDDNTCVPATKRVAGDTSYPTCVFVNNYKNVDEYLWCTSRGSLDITTSSTPAVGCLGVANSNQCLYGFYNADIVSSACSCPNDPAVINNYIEFDDMVNQRPVCKAQEFIDFGQFLSLPIANVKTGNKEYTIEFWSYIQSYMSNQFTGGFEIQWKGQLRVLLKFVAGTYTSTCYPLYTTTTDDVAYATNNNSPINLDMSNWVYVRCSVSHIQGRYFHYSDSTAKASRTETALNFGTPAVSFVIPTSTTVTFVNNSINRGVVYFRQIRLWACYKCHQPIQYRQILSSATAIYYHALLHLWDPVYTGAVASYPGTLIDQRNASGYTLNGNTYSGTTTLTTDSTWLGYNRLKKSLYRTINTTSGGKLCTEDLTECGQTYDCPIGCTTCNYNVCLSCDSGFELKNDACINKINVKSNEQFFFKSPAVVSKGSATTQDFAFAPLASVITGTSTAMSVSFFVKVISLKDSDYFFFIYGTKLKLKYFVTPDSLQLVNGDGTITYGTFASFSTLVGKWINISVSYYYNSAVVNYFPAMMNLQVNSNNVVIDFTQDMNNLGVDSATAPFYGVNSIIIPKETTAIFGKIWMMPNYSNGFLAEVSYQTNNEFSLISNTRSYTITKYFDIQYYDNNTCMKNVNWLKDPTSTVYSTCYFVNEYNNVDEYNYCPNYAGLENSNVANNYTPSGCLAANSICSYGYYNADSTNSLCSCTNSSSIQDYFIQQNVGNNQCVRHQYVDFGQTLTTSPIANVNFGNTEYTIEFWTYINTYVSGTFTNGFDIFWDNQLRITLKYNALLGSYTSSCFPLYSTTLANTNYDEIQLDMSKWVYIRCSVSLTHKRFFHYYEYMPNAIEKTLIGTLPNFPYTTTTLILTNNSINRGVIFFRQFRLWSCYVCQSPILYRKQMTNTTARLYTALLHLWDPVYTKTSGVNYPGTVTDMRNGDSINPVAYTTTWLGYNILNFSNNYQLLTSTVAVDNVQVGLFQTVYSSNQAFGATIASCNDLLGNCKLSDFNTPYIAPASGNTQITWPAGSYIQFINTGNTIVVNGQTLPNIQIIQYNSSNAQIVVVSNSGYIASISNNGLIYSDYNNAINSTNYFFTNSNTFNTALYYSNSNTALPLYAFTITTIYPNITFLNMYLMDTSILCPENELNCKLMAFCPIGCATCVYDKCLSCVIKSDGTSNYSLVNGNCLYKDNNVHTELFFFQSPAYSSNSLNASDAVDLELSPATGVNTGTATAFACSFFTKISAISGTNSLVFRYGLDLILFYRNLDDTMVLSNNDASVIFATVANVLHPVDPALKSIINAWINISLSYYYNSNSLVNNVFPAMMNFQFNSKNVKINNVNLNNLRVNKMIISKLVSGIFAKVWVMPRYSVGVLAEVSNINRNFAFTKYINGVVRDNNICMLDTEKANTTVFTKCVYVNDFLNIDEQAWCTQYAVLNSVTPYGCLTSNSSCEFGFYSSNSLCACSSDNTIRSSYIQLNSGDNKCAKQDYVDFGQTSTTVIPNVKPGDATAGTYTLEFWTYVKTYIDGKFGNGFDFLWDNQLAINIRFDSVNNRFESTCYPLYSSSGNSFPNTANGFTLNEFNKDNYNSFKLNQDPVTNNNNFSKWVYLRCSVNYQLKRFFFVYEFNNYNSSEQLLQGNKPTQTLSTTLTIRNNAINSGVVYFRQIRLWDIYTGQMPIQYKKEITSLQAISLTHLLHQWDPVFKTGIYPGTVTDIKGVLVAAGQTATTTDFAPATDASWLGYNTINADSYYTLTSPTYLCDAALLQCNNLNYFCPIGCKTCNRNVCETCYDNYSMDANGTCYLVKGIPRYYFAAPAYNTVNTSTAVDLVFNAVSGVTTAFTCSFMLKMKSALVTAALSHYDIFRYGSGLKLTHNKVNNSLVLSNGNGSIVFATYTNFSAVFDTWVNISLSYFYSASIDSYFPAMMNFQVNLSNVKITATAIAIKNLGVNAMVIPKESNAYYAKVWVSQYYTNGAYAEVTYKPVLPNVRNFQFTKLIIGTVYSYQCIDLTTITGNVNFNCVLEYDDPLLDEAVWCPVYSFLSLVDSTPQNISNGSTGCQSNYNNICSFYGVYSVSNGSSPLCSCTSNNFDLNTMLIDNNGDNTCQLQKYVDFGQTTVTTINNVVAPKVEYTMEFWVYIKTYITGTFTGGLELRWDNLLAIQIKYLNNKFQSTCFPMYMSNARYSNAYLTGVNIFGLNQTGNNNVINPDFSKWVYIRCGVNTDSTIMKYHHFYEVLQTDEISLTGTIPLNTLATTTLVVENKSINTGVIFLKQLRLWSCYLCQSPDTFVLNITSLTVNQYSKLLHLWDPEYTSANGTYPGIVTDLKAVASFTPVVDANWIGYNIVDTSNFTPLGKTAFTTPNNNQLCNEFLQSCTGLLKLNEIADISLQVKPALYGRYTIELWAMVTDVTVLTNGFHIVWKNMASVSVTNTSANTGTMGIFCWPQDFKIKLDTSYRNIDIENLASSQLNSDTTTTSNYVGGTWFWIRCAVDNNMKQYYLNANTLKTLQSDLMWKNQSTDTPFRYFWQNHETTQLNIIGANLRTSVDIYIRQVYLFNDYIPQTYDFKNEDLTSLNSSSFSSLAFSVSFLKYWYEINKVVYKQGTSTTLTFTPTKRANVVEFNYQVNLQVQSNCDPTGNTKYVSATNQCVGISNCNLTNLNAKFCMNENTPLVCASGFDWDTSKYVVNASTACQQVCTSPYMRAPNSSTDSAICNFTCGAGTLNCPSTSSAQDNISNTFSCQAGMSQYNYKCIDSVTAQNTYMYFNGCYNFPNLSYNFASGTNTKFQNGYTVQFWMKIDRKNEFCSTGTKRKYYFVLEPHTIYLDTTSIGYTDPNSTTNSYTNSIVYENINDVNLRGALTVFSVDNWNVITIHVNLVTRKLRVYSNLDFFTPDIAIDNIPSTTNLDITKMLWCSTSGNGANDTNCSAMAYAQNLAWGAAFYRDINVWDGANSNPWVIQDYIGQQFSDKLPTYFNYFPFNLNNAVGNNIANLVQTGDGVNYYTRYADDTLNTINSLDKDALMNYSSKFEYSDFNPGQFVVGLNTAQGEINTSSCVANCKRCVSAAASGCIKCMPGYKLFSNTCQAYTGYYAKFPLTSFNNFLTLNVQSISNNYILSNENEFTFTVWIKFYGQLASSSSQCVKLFRFKADGSRYICYNPSTRILYFYDGVNVLYQDTTVFNSYIGQWVLISFSSFVNYNAATPTLGNYFNYLHRFYVQDQEIVKNASYTAPAPGITFDSIDIGFEFSALIADLRVFRNFIINPYGYVLSASNTQKLNLNISFTSSTSTSTATGLLCMTDSNINASNYTGLSLIAPNTSYLQQFGLACVNDYMPYKSATCTANSYFDISLYPTKGTTCSSCSSICTSTCTNKGTNSCTCDFDSANNWLKVDSLTNKLSCETPTYPEFSKGSVTVNNIKVSPYQEYSVEFWFYIYNYNNNSSNNGNNNIAFDSHEIIWDLHNYIKIYKNNDNGISVRCAPVYNSTLRSSYIGPDTNTNSANFGNYNYGYDDVYASPASTPAYGVSTGAYATWVYVQCSTSIPRNLFYLNQRGVSNIQYAASLIPNNANVTSTTLTINAGDNAKTNYGFMFIRELKLWSQYNIRKFSTLCTFTSTSIPYYPLLSHYFDNISKGDLIVDEINKNVKAAIIKRSDFIGYNVVSIAKATTVYSPATECSKLVIFPTTGFTNTTIFEFQAQEVGQVNTNSYQYYYNIKNTDVDVTLDGISNERNLHYMFNFTPSVFLDQTISNNNTLLIDIYCSVTYARLASEILNNTPARVVTLYQELVLQKQVSFDANTTFASIVSTANIQTNITSSELLTKSLVVSNLQSDLAVPYVDNFPILTSTSINPISNSTATPTDILLVQSVSTPATCAQISNYCNGRGFCYALNINLFCQCQSNFNGDNCQLEKNNTAAWMTVQNNLVNMYMNRIASTNSSTVVVDSNLIQSVDLLFNTTSKLISNYSDAQNFVDIMTQLTDLSTNPSVASTFDSSASNLYNIASTMFKLNLKSANNDKYQIVNDSLNNETSTGNANVSYTIQYVNINSENSTARRLLTAQLDANILINPNMTYILNIKDSSLIKLTDAQKAQYTDSMARINTYIQKISVGIFLANKATGTAVDKIYNSNEFNLVIKKISDVNTFDFVDYFTNTLQRKNNNNAYFDAKSCLVEFIANNNNSNSTYDFTNLFFVYIEYIIPDKYYNSELYTNLVSTTHTISFYDNNGKEIILTCNSGVVHYLPINLIGNANVDFVKDVGAGFEKYSPLAISLSNKFTFQYLPYYIFANGTIDHSDTQSQIKKYYRNYDVKVQYYDTTSNAYNSTHVNLNQITSDGYIIGTSKHLSEYSSFATYAPITRAAKNYYFMDFNQLYTCIDNVHGNMCFYIVILFFIFHILTLLLIIVIGWIYQCSKSTDTVEQFRSEYEREIIDINKENEKFGEVRVHSDETSIWKVKVGYMETNINGVPQASAKKLVTYSNEKIEEINHNEKDDKEDKEAKVEIRSQKVLETEQINLNTAPKQTVVEVDRKVRYTDNSCYNLFYFIFCKNIYVNLFTVNSPFVPAYKRVTKFVFLIYTLLLLVVLMCVYVQQDLTAFVIQNQGQLAGFIFISVYCSNAVLLVVSMLFKVLDGDRKYVVDAVKEMKPEALSLVWKFNVMNAVKTVLLNLINIGLAGILYYFSVGFCAVWIDWAHNLLILWLLTLIVDFIIFEIVQEIFIYFFYLCRNSNGCFKTLFNIVLGMKNLRNYA